MTKNDDDDYKGNKHIPDRNTVDSEEPVTASNEPMIVPDKKGDLKNVITDEKV